MERRIADEPLDPDALARETRDEESGALVTVCDRAPAGPARDGAGEPGADDGGSGLGARAIQRAERRLAELEDAAVGRFEVRRCRLQVRPGAPAGEPAVVAVVRAAHRSDAFDAAGWAVATVREQVLPLVTGRRGRESGRGSADTPSP